jgi:hypothetical protein
MASQRTRLKRRRSGKGFSMLVHEYFTSAQYAKLSPVAVKALVDLYTQFRGHNNGDLCAAWPIMTARGWRSKGALAKALQELLDGGWILISRMGGNRVARLYAVSWLGIDHCDGKLDVKPNPVPMMLWKTATPPTKRRALRGAAAASAAISAPRPAGQSAPPHGSKVESSPELCPAPRVSTWG